MCVQQINWINTLNSISVWKQAMAKDDKYN